MKRHFWIVPALIVGVGGLMFGLSRAPAQRGEGGLGFAPREPVGRYQVVRSNELQVVLLDTATGDLYSATPRDFKPYSDRPRAEGRRPFGDREPGKEGFDKGRFEKGFEKDRPKFDRKDFPDKEEKFEKKDSPNKEK
jgi:hypothetical protein